MFVYRECLILNRSITYKIARVITLCFDFPLTIPLTHYRTKISILSLKFSYYNAFNLDLDMKLTIE